jgi:uncharacterized protein YbjT (DUF2867 family)
VSDPRPILVVGGTGMLGRPVVDALVEAGTPVRVLSRYSQPDRPGVTFMTGSVTDPASLRTALTGCRAVHISLRGTNAAELDQIEIGGTRAVAKAANEAGVSRIGYLSGAGMEAADPRLAFVRVKQAGEDAVRQSGCEWMLFRATHFMESLDLFVRGDKVELMTPQPLSYHYLAARDYARMVARAYAEPAAANMAFTMLGPHALTMRAALEAYVACLHPGMKIRTTPVAVLKAVAMLTRNGSLKHTALLFSTFPKIPETTNTTTTKQLLGQAETTLAEWCNLRAA